MFTHLEAILLSYAGQVHLAIFSPAVSFTEEIIPPIPSPSVMIATGVMAEIQGYLFYGLVILVLLGALGKTLGAILVYFVTDKIEDVFSGKITKFLGITHEQIEGLGRRLSKDWKDYIVLTILRSLPIVPSSLLSVGCGLLKISFKLFWISTFVGSIIRNAIFIYLGYTGTKVAISYFENTVNSLESAIQILAVLLILILLGYLFYKRRKSA